MSLKVSTIENSPLALMSPCSSVIHFTGKNKNQPSQIYTFGGYIPGGDDNNILLLFDSSNGQWNTIKNSGKDQWPQGKPQASLIARKSSSLVLYGGMDSNELWEYSIAKKEWTQLNGTQNENRSNHTSVYLDKMDTMVVYGGTINNEMNTGFIGLYNFAEKKWKKFKPKEKPEFERLDHTSVLWKDEFMIVFGGIDGEDHSLNDVWKLYCTPHKWSPVGLNLKWEKLECKGDIPAPRSRHAATIFENKMYIYGGVSEEGDCFNDLYVLDLETLEWQKLELLSSTIERNGHVLHALPPKVEEESSEDSENVDEEEEDDIPIIPDLYIMFGNDKEFKVLNQVELLQVASMKDMLDTKLEKSLEKLNYDFSLQIEYGMLKKKLECSGISAIEFLILKIADVLGLSAQECKVQWKDSNGKWKDLKSTPLSSLSTSIVIKVEDEIH